MVWYCIVPYTMYKCIVRGGLYNLFNFPDTKNVLHVSSITPQCFLAHNVLFPVRWFHQRTHPPHSIFSFRHCEVWLPTVSIALAVRSTDTMIKSLGLQIAIICALASLTNAFNTTPMQCTIMSRRHGSPSSLSMIFGPPKDDGKPGDYVCKVNAIVFTTLYYTKDAFVFGFHLIDMAFCS